MNLAIDVGNTTIKFGIYKKSLFINSFVCDYDINNFKSKNVIKFLLAKLKENHITLYQIEDIMYCSVVPQINKKFKDDLKHLFGLEIHNIEIIRNDLKLLVEHPEVVGQDLLGDIYGAIYKKYAPCLIIDLGTANKFLLVNKENEFVSCVFSIGLQTALNALSEKTALLEKTNLEKPLPLLQIKDTNEALVAGAIYTAARSIEGICKDFETALGYKLNKVITGGNVKFVFEQLNGDYIWDETLILDSLNEILLRLKGDSNEL